MFDNSLGEVARNTSGLLVSGIMVYSMGFVLLHVMPSLTLW